MNRTLHLSGPHRLRLLHDDVAGVEAPEPLAVGVRVTLEHDPPLPGLPVTGKVIDVARQGDRFRLRLRLFAPDRTARETLRGLLPPEA